MVDILRQWFVKYLANEEVIVLLASSIVLVLAILFLGDVLVPIFVAIALAYLLQGAVKRLTNIGMPRLMAVSFVELIFVLFIIAATLLVFPVLWAQIKNFVNELPNMLQYVQKNTYTFLSAYPQWISANQIEELNLSMQNKITEWATTILSFSFSKLSNVFNILVYTFLIPVLIFFFLKDKEQIATWMTQFLPEKRPFIRNLTQEMNLQISNYVRGKVIEIFVVGICCFIILTVLDVRYTLLISVLTGLSVLVPYFGAMAVGLVLLGVGLFQFGASVDLLYVMTAYTILQILDGNVLVPILFSEAVNLHPTAILIAVLVFGGLWGFWGLFFAIPLATLVHALIRSWPRQKSPQAPQVVGDSNSQMEQSA